MAKVNFDQWEGFGGHLWKEEVNVRDFIQHNYTQYDGDESFLAGPTEATDKLWGELSKLQKEERAKGGVLDMETEVVSGLTAYGPGYINEEMKDLEQVVGLQINRLRERSCRTAESRWQSRLVRHTDIHRVKNCMKSLPNIIKHTTRQYLMCILLR